MGATDATRSGAPLTRAERRRKAQARRNRLIVVLGVVVSVAIVGAWFPASDLLHQRQQLSASSSELHRLDTQNQSLRQRAKQLETPNAVGRIAQQQYDLVQPGEQAYQVLPASSSDGAGTLSTPPAGSGTAAGTSGGGASGGGTSGGAATASDGHGAKAGTTGATTSSSFLGRVLQTLEFWR